MSGNSGKQPEDPVHTPFYMKKYSPPMYVRKGEPKELTEDDLPNAVRNWVALTSKELELWDDARTAVLQKKKRREYSVIPSPTRTVGSRHVMEIKILHIDHKGFKYEATDKDLTELEKRFWPTVLKLLAHFFAPTIAAAPAVSELR